MQTGKTWKMENPAIEGADCIDADAVQALRGDLIKRDDSGIDFDRLQEKIFIADAGQAVFFLVR